MIGNAKRKRMKFCAGQRGSRGQFLVEFAGKNHLGIENKSKPTVDQEKRVKKYQWQQKLAGLVRILGSETLETGVRRLQWQPLPN